MMDDVLEPIKDIANSYIDDILVVTFVAEGEDLFSAHDRELRRVWDLLQEKHLVVDISKCQPFVPGVQFCGHILA